MLDSQHVLDWLVPVLLGLIVLSLQGMSGRLRTIGEKLATIIQKVQDHDRRISRLEGDPGSSDGDPS